MLVTAVGEEDADRLAVLPATAQLTSESLQLVREKDRNLESCGDKREVASGRAVRVQRRGSLSRQSEELNVSDPVGVSNK